MSFCRCARGLHQLSRYTRLFSRKQGSVSRLSRLRVISCAVQSVRGFFPALLTFAVEDDTLEMLSISLATAHFFPLSSVEHLCSLQTLASFSQGSIQPSERDTKRVQQSVLELMQFSFPFFAKFQQQFVLETTWTFYCIFYQK